MSVQSPSAGLPSNALSGLSGWKEPANGSCAGADGCRRLVVKAGERRRVGAVGAGAEVVAIVAVVLDDLDGDALVREPHVEIGVPGVVDAEVEVDVGDLRVLESGAEIDVRELVLER